MQITNNRTNGAATRLLVSAPAGLEPALLAFLKCHVASVTTWDALRCLAEREGTWHDPGQVARSLQRPRELVQAELRRLAEEGVLDEGPEGIGYRLPAGERTSAVVQRLIEQCVERPEVRALVVAHLARAQRPNSSAA